MHDTTLPAHLPIENFRFDEQTPKYQMPRSLEYLSCPNFLSENYFSEDSPQKTEAIMLFGLLMTHLFKL